jgi:pilus assembly protein Flp/PilA
LRRYVAPRRGQWKKDVQMSKFIKRFVADESGATAIEYGLIAALIAIVLIAAMSNLQEKISGTFNNVASQMP